MLLNKENELTTRQWQLYNYLKSNYEPNKWIPKNEIALSLGYESEAYNPRGNYRVIENDIRTINDSGIIQKIVISSPKGYKIANEEEAKKWLDEDFDRLMKALKRHNFKRKKVHKNGQMRIVFDGERDTIESYM